MASIAVVRARRSSPHSSGLVADFIVRAIVDLTSQQLEAWFAEAGQPPYRAGQLMRWLFQRRVGNWAEMTDLPESIRDRLKQAFVISSSHVAAVHESADGTEKLLVRLTDGRQVECVLLRDSRRRTWCLSTQVGCGMGCVFCASGLDGVERNLTSGEITEQMLHLLRRMKPQETLTHIVVMGMGEPLANLDGMLPALRMATASHGLGISPRRITISTVGLPQAMRRLAREAPQFRLAVSLHAPTDQLRSQIVPTNRNVGLSAILEAADIYFRASGRRLTFEYVLLAGINDRPEHAHLLARRLGSRTALVNLIPYNPVPSLPYRTPDRKAQATFRAILQRKGVRVKIRHRKGDRIDAACGQLRRQEIPQIPRCSVSSDSARVG